MKQGIFCKAACVVASVAMAGMMIPAQAFAATTDPSGNTVWAEETIASLPSSFDLRDCDLNPNDGNAHENYVTSVKNQASFGTCWAFGDTAASETSILTSRNQQAKDAEGNDTINLSEKQIAYFAYNTSITAEQDAAQEGEGTFFPTEDNVYTVGGSGDGAADLFSSGTGASNESSNKQFVYNGYNAKNGQTVDTRGGDWDMSDSLRFYSDYSLKSSSTLPDPAATSKYFDPTRDEGIAAIKSELAAGRGVAIGFCADSASSDQLNNPSKYINPKTYAHYTYEATTSNHEVCVVGWDDNYSKENFATEQPVVGSDGKAVTDKNGNIIMRSVEQPAGDGAWIVKNSWGGTDGKGLDYGKDWGVDGTGYFYISYYDKSVCKATTFNFDTTDTDYIIDQSSYSGAMAQKTEESTDPMSACNVFTAKQDESVSRLMAYVSKQNSTVTYTLYRLTANCANPGQGEKLYTTTVDYKYSGWKSVDLPQSYDMPKGTRYAVEIQTVSGAGKYYFGVPRDWNERGFEEGDVLGFNMSEACYIEGVINEGESYICYGGEWSDELDYLDEIKAEDIGLYDYDNFRIKAYCTAGVDNSTNLSKATVTVGAGGTYTGKAKTPAVKVTLGGKTVAASNYKVSYSNNVNAGKATVTVSGLGKWAGEASATFTIKRAAAKGFKVATGAKVKIAAGKTLALKAKGCSGAELKWSKVSGNKLITVSAKGILKASKKLAKGTYKVKVKCAASATTNYCKASATKVIKVTVK